MNCAIVEHYETSTDNLVAVESSFHQQTRIVSLEADNGEGGCPMKDMNTRNSPRLAFKTLSEKQKLSFQKCFEWHEIGVNQLTRELITPIMGQKQKGNL